MLKPDENGLYPLSGREYESLQMYMAALSSLEDTGNLTKRLTLIPDAAETLKTVQEKLSDLLIQILRTIPEKKRYQIREDLNMIRVKLVYGMYPDKLDHGLICVRTDALLALLDQLISMECMLCEKRDKAVKRCPVRELIENITAYDMEPEFDHPSDGTCQMRGRSSISEEVKG